MTELDYIILTDLKAARIAARILGDIVTANNPHVPAVELASVLRAIDRWTSAMSRYVGDRREASPQ